MRFTTVLLSASAAALTSAQAYFTMATLPVNIAPGTNYQLSWLNGQGTSTVSLYLLQGTQQNLATVATIATGQSHNGTYTWSPSSSLASGTNYAFKIVDDSNNNNINYSDMFAISTGVTGSNSAISVSVTATGSASSSASSQSSASITSGTSGSTTASSSASAASTSGSSSIRASAATTPRATSNTSSATAAVTAAVNGATPIKVGGGLLALVAAVMMAL